MIANTIDPATDVITSVFLNIAEKRVEGTGRVPPFPKSVTELTVRRRRPLRIEIDEDESWSGGSKLVRSAAREEKAIVSIPLISEGDVLGALQFRSKDSHAYDQLADEFLERLAAQLAGVIAYDRVNKKLEIEATEQVTLAQISRILGSELDLHTAIDHVAETLKELVPFDSMFASTFDLENETRTNVYHTPGSTSAEQLGRTRPYAGMISNAVVEKKAIVRIQLGEDGKWDDGDPLLDSVARGERSIVALPMFSEGKLFGVVAFHSAALNAYAHLTDEFLERVAGHLAGAIAYHQINSELQEEANRQAVLANIGQLISSDLDIESAFEQVAKALSEIIEFDIVFVTMTNESRTAARDVVFAGRLSNEYHHNF